MRSTGAGTYRSLLKIQKSHRGPPSTLIQQHFHVAAMSEDEGVKAAAALNTILPGQPTALCFWVIYLQSYPAFHETGCSESWHAPATLRRSGTHFNSFHWVKTLGGSRATARRAVDGPQLGEIYGNWNNFLLLWHSVMAEKCLSGST